MTFPNQLTILRILLTPVFITMLFVDTFSFRLGALIVFFVASLTDWYDGYIARKFGSVSNWGKFLDPLADKILVLSTFCAFWVIGYMQLWMLIVIAARDLAITGLRTYAMKKNPKQPLVTSTWAKWKTASQMGAIYLILFYLIFKNKVLTAGSQSAWLYKLESISFVDKLMYGVTIITATTGIHYLFENRHHIKALANSVCRFMLPTSFIS